MKRNTTSGENASGSPPRPAPPVLTQRIPRCPRCGSTRWRAYATRSMGDEVKARYSRCGSCDLRVVLVVEPVDDDDAEFITNSW